MTVITPPRSEAAAQAVLEAAEAHYARTVLVLNEIIDEVLAGQSARAKDLKGALSDLNKATQTAFDERSRVEKRFRTESGVVHDYALDFAAARDEIGRRLACLRGAAAAGGVSQGVE